MEPAGPEAGAQAGIGLKRYSSGGAGKSPGGVISDDLTGVLRWRERGLTTQGQIVLPDSIRVSRDWRPGYGIHGRGDPVTGSCFALRPIFPLLASKTWHAACDPTESRKRLLKFVLPLAERCCGAVRAVDTDVLVRLLTGDGSGGKRCRDRYSRGNRSGSHSRSCSASKMSRPRMNRRQPRRCARGTRNGTGRRDALDEPPARRFICLVRQVVRRARETRSGI